MLMLESYDFSCLPEHFELKLFKLIMQLVICTLPPKQEKIAVEARKRRLCIKAKVVTSLGRNPPRHLMRGSQECDHQTLSTLRLHQHGAVSLLSFPSQ